MSGTKLAGGTFNFHGWLADDILNIQWWRAWGD
jgi:hypothetical protein